MSEITITMTKYNGKEAGGALILCPECMKPNTFSEWLAKGFLKKHVCDGCGFTNTYPPKRGNVDLYNRVVYTAKCTGHKITVITQSDNSPEYHTSVSVLCPIHKKLINFDLPVN